MNIFRYISRLSLFLYFIISMVSAEHEVVSSVGQLNDLIKNNKLAVLMFYYKDDTLNTKKMGYAKYSERLLKRTALKDRYDDSDVMFIEVNISNKNLEGLKTQYSVKKYPTFFLFIDGKAVVDSSKERIYLQDIPEEDELVEFIERHLREEINKIVGEESYDYYEDDDEDDEYYYYPARRYYRRHHYYPYNYYHPYGYYRYNRWPYYGRRYHRYHRGGFGFGFGW